MGAADDVRRLLAGADVSREGRQAEWDGDPPPIGEGDLRLQNLMDLSARQGQVIKALATAFGREEDVDEITGRAAATRAGALDASLYGPHATSHERVFGDVAHIARARREAIVLLAEHAPNPAVVQEHLEAAPVPDEPEPSLEDVRSALEGNSAALIELTNQVET